MHLRLTFGAGAHKYPAKTHVQRVAEALKYDDGLILVKATPAENWPNSDMPAPFRQDRNFYYITGCNEPNCYVTYNLKRDRLTLWLPSIDKSRVVWYGRGSTVEEAMEKYDIDDAKYFPSQRYIAGVQMNRRANVMSELEFIIKHCEMEDGHLGAAQNHDSGPLLMLRYFADSLPELDRPGAISEQNSSPKDLQRLHHQRQRGRLDGPALEHAFHSARVIKDEYEIELLREANKITAAAHSSVFKNIHSYTNEAQVEAAYMHTCIAHRAKLQAYDPIAGAGPNAAILHYSENLADFGDGQTLVLDAGCEVACYASDVTRTVPLNPRGPGTWPSLEAQSIYRIVESVQESCIARLRPGVSFIEITWHAQHLMITALLNLGLLKGDRDEIFHAGTVRGFFPHGLGHFMGLDVHDVSPNPHPPLTSAEQKGRERLLDLQRHYIKWRPDSARWVDSGWGPEQFGLLPHAWLDPHCLDSSTLAAGHVVTVEPGLYFNLFMLEELFLNIPVHRKHIDRPTLERYMQVGGVRIEDDILITDTGYENLTTTPKGESMLQMIRDAATPSWI